MESSNVEKASALINNTQNALWFVGEDCDVIEGSSNGDVFTIDLHKPVSSVDATLGRILENLTVEGKVGISGDGKSIYFYV